MARIVLADDGIEFDGTTPNERPLGGVESATVDLTRELARRGHDVSVHNMCRKAIDHDGVKWRPVKDGLPETADLYIANRGDKLIRAMPGAKKTVFWIHNPAQYLLKWRYLWKLWAARPPIIFIGDYHRTTYPSWAPDGGRVVIPYGVADMFCTPAERKSAPEPRAVFTSNPLRSLDWLLDVWAARIHPAIKDAEFHIFSGAAVYGKAGARKGAAMGAVLDKAAGLRKKGVVLRGPVPKNQLVKEFQDARVMLYRGDENETFCSAVAEAQAAGLPGVVCRLGSMPERIKDRQTGFVADNDKEFAARAVDLLGDDDLWRGHHHQCIQSQRAWRWPDVAKAFEELIG